MALEVEDFECTLCLKLLVKPSTTTCGHSFCRECLGKALRHQAKCPMCRTCLHASPDKLAVATDLARALETAFPEAYAARLEDLQAELKEIKEAKGKAELAEVAALPCFLLTAILPGQRMSLHIFEPRYRLLTQRCLEGSRRFGMVPRHSADCGTEVEIVECEELPGGRFFMEVVARRVFHITEAWNTDGYVTARVRIIEPEVQEELALDPDPEASALARRVGHLCVTWQQLAMKYGALSAEQSVRLVRELGPMPQPERPAARALWVASLINPVRPMPQAAPDMRHAFLLATTAMGRLQVVESALERSITSLQPTWEGQLLRKIISSLGIILRYAARNSWLVAAGWLARRQLVA